MPQQLDEVIDLAKLVHLVRPGAAFRSLEADSLKKGVWTLYATEWNAQVGL